MRVLYINYESLITNSTLTVRNKESKVEYLITNQLKNDAECFIINSLYGDELARITQINAGIIPQYKLIQNNKLISKFLRPLNFSNEIFYLSRLHWLVYGNLLKMNYKIRLFNQEILKTKLVKKVPKRLKISINTLENEPLCLCIIAILNFWAKDKMNLEKNELCEKYLAHDLL